jgi:hypothetical protein
MAAFRHNMKLWAIWILGASSLLLANPWGELGWIELAAALAPLLMIVERRIGREPALAFGLPALTLMWLAHPAHGPMLQLVAIWGVFVGGVLLAARAIQSQSELEAIAGQVAFAPIDTTRNPQFELALERELGRARRHERPFAILSAAPHLHPPETDPSGFFRTELLRSLTETRALLELRDFLRGELHIYAEVETQGQRVLALVPEVDEDTLAFLLERLKNAAEEHFDFEVRLGAGRFPRDAVCADELIATADRNRGASKLRPLPDRVIGIAGEPFTRRSPDVQG